MAYLNCEIYSKALRMPTSVSVILPQDVCASDRPIASLYLLHGRSHNHSVWHRYTSVERYAEQYNLAVIMPEVNRSFYTDMAYGVDYFTYITEELPMLCESMFKIDTTASHRYVAGMSMGGYGALKAALSHPTQYAGCAAISAVTDIQMHLIDTPEDNPKKNEFRGIFGQKLKADETNDLHCLAQKITTHSIVPRFYFSCGLEDHLYPEGKLFQNYLMQSGISVYAEEWHGCHDWQFWDCAIEKVISYFFGENAHFKHSCENNKQNK